MCCLKPGSENKEMTLNQKKGKQNNPARAAGWSGPCQLGEELIPPDSSDILSQNRGQVWFMFIRKGHSPYGVPFATHMFVHETPVLVLVGLWNLEGTRAFGRLTPKEEPGDKSSAPAAGSSRVMKAACQNGRRQCRLNPFTCRTGS